MNMGSTPIAPIGTIQLVSWCIPKRNCEVDVAIVGGNPIIQIIQLVNTTIGHRGFGL